MIKAVVLCAGRGTRLRPRTNDRPKCMVELGGQTILDHQRWVFAHAGVDEVHVVGGHCADTIPTDGLRVHVNRDYAHTNMVWSLFVAEELWGGDADVIVSYGDIVYSPAVLRAVVDHEASVAVSIDRCWRSYWSERMEDPLQDAETLQLADDGRILHLGGRPADLSEVQGQYMGLFKVASDDAPAFRQAWRAMVGAARPGEPLAQTFMTDFLQHLIDEGWPIQAVPVDRGWFEIDGPDDLALAEERVSGLWEAPRFSPDSRG